MDAVNMRGSEHEWKDVYRMCLIMNQQQLWDVAPSPQPYGNKETQGEKKRLCTEGDDGKINKQQIHQLNARRCAGICRDM